ncbi:DivIVA domain-containing protein [Plantactinospora soyae]|uniref:Cell wall synthesis protein Wag31 n=1 Tax=Plantactinospora soyae TaxID=1544732 RepID=A0A927MF59_9ACTN|nr:DivIVA domain-containing protein [Plantactinospora soyae]MBE1490000.1 DivIVA domain-containing protein [Plantactinospora soyae]
MSNLTPSDVRNIAFKKPALGRRGYDEQEVDEFLEEVESTIAAMTEEIATLRAQSGPTGTPPSAITAPLDQQGVVLAQLEEIKAQLGRIESAVGGGPRYPFGDPIFRS